MERFPYAKLLNVTPSSLQKIPEPSKYERFSE